MQGVDGRSSPEELLTTPDAHGPGSWTSDGQVLAPRRWTEGKIEFVSRDNKGVPEWSLPGWGGQFSPDDRWLAYGSDETGQFEIWVRSFPDGDTVRQISVDYGIEVVWCQECDELFYRKGNQWMASTVSLSPELSWEPPRVVFQTDFIDTPGLSYDVSPDGQRLLVVKRTREPERAKLHIVVNWFEELKRLVPTK